MKYEMYKQLTKDEKEEWDYKEKNRVWFVFGAPFYAFIVLVLLGLANLIAAGAITEVVATAIQRIGTLLGVMITFDVVFLLFNLVEVEAWKKKHFKTVRK